MNNYLKLHFYLFIYFAFLIFKFNPFSQLLNFKINKIHIKKNNQLLLKKFNESKIFSFVDALYDLLH